MNDFIYNQDMKYLAYHYQGFLRKIPLDRPVLSLGRTVGNDIVLENEFVSRLHLHIHVNDQDILIKDNQTPNGTFFLENKVKEARIKPGESFMVGGIEFQLKEGSAAEFTLSKQFNAFSPEKSTAVNQPANITKTHIYRENKYKFFLYRLLQRAMDVHHFNEVIDFLPSLAADFEKHGNLYLVVCKNQQPIIQFSIGSQLLIPEFEKIIDQIPGILTEKVKHQKTNDDFPDFISYPVRIYKEKYFLMFQFHTVSKEDELLLDQWLSGLARTLELLAGIFNHFKENSDLPAATYDYIQEIVSGSEKIKKLITQAEKIAASDIFVLVEGESGVGKELFARLLHNCSRRKQNKLIAINCAAIPETLLESELFGAEKGAFTGAFSQQKGKLELASGGTLILDEIGEMPVHLQSKLLRALQESEFYRLGGTQPIQVDLRIISLTNCNLKELIEQGKFRQDLYYRLVHRTISVPPLRERKEDIPVLINHFTRQICQKTNKSINGFTVKAYEYLQNYDWPGNIRQLENEIKSIVNLTENGGIVTHELLSSEVTEISLTAASRHKILDALSFNAKPDKDAILNLLEKNHGNKAQTARDLNMTYQGLHKRMKRLGIDTLDADGQ